MPPHERSRADTSDDWDFVVTRRTSCAGRSPGRCSCQVVNRAPGCSAYCRITNIGIRPRPSANVLNALPMIAPGVKFDPVAFMACPAIGDVVRRSPTSIGAEDASAMQKTLPIKPIGAQ